MASHSFLGIKSERPVSCFGNLTPPSSWLRAILDMTVSGKIPTPIRNSNPVRPVWTCQRKGQEGQHSPPCCWAMTFVFLQVRYHNDYNCHVLRFLSALSITGVKCQLKFNGEWLISYFHPLPHFFLYFIPFVPPFHSLVSPVFLSHSCYLNDFVTRGPVGNTSKSCPIVTALLGIWDNIARAHTRTHKLSLAIEPRGCKEYTTVLL
jgi:hypothetical protein